MVVVNLYFFSFIYYSIYPPPRCLLSDLYKVEEVQGNACDNKEHCFQLFFHPFDRHGDEGGDSSRDGNNSGGKQNSSSRRSSNIGAFFSRLSQLSHRSSSHRHVDGDDDGQEQKKGGGE